MPLSEQFHQEQIPKAMNKKSLSQNQSSAPEPNLNVYGFGLSCMDIIRIAFEKMYVTFYNGSALCRAGKTQNLLSAQTLAALFAVFEMQEQLNTSDKEAFDIIRETFSANARIKPCSDILDLTNINTYYKSFNVAFEPYFRQLVEGKMKDERQRPGLLLKT